MSSEPHTKNLLMGRFCSLPRNILPQDTYLWPMLFLPTLLICCTVAFLMQNIDVKKIFLLFAMAFYSVIQQDILICVYSHCKTALVSAARLILLITRLMDLLKGGLCSFATLPESWRHNGWVLMKYMNLQILKNNSLQ